MEKKTDQIPDLRLRGLLKGIIPAVATIALAVMTACRRALSPQEQERFDNSMAEDIVKELTKGMQNPPRAQRDLENYKRFIILLPVSFPELAEVSDSAMRKAEQAYNAHTEKNPSKSKVLKWTRTDARSFSVEMEFYSSQR